MKETNSASEIILVLTEHPIFGVLLIPYMAERTSDGDQIHLMEQAFHASEKAMAKMTHAERQAIEIASHYTEKYLTQVYSREKTTARFLRKLTEEPERVKETIRPFIDKKLQEMVGFILKGELTLYQKQGTSKVLYAHHAYHINPEPVTTSFLFEVEGESFSYQLECTHKGQPLPLTERKPVLVLTSSPATLVLGMELYSFQHMEAPRLLPFTKKTRVTVNATFLQKYIDNIIIPIASYHEITTRGIDIAEEKRECQPLLCVEETIYEEPLLSLLFTYDDQTFVPDNSTERKKFIRREESGDGNALRYFCRDYETEQKAIDLLTAAGLEQVSDSHYKLSSSAPESSISEWISNHRELLLKEFQLTNASQEKTYCLDEIRIEQNYEDGPDWFELHIVVVVGTHRIPFSRFRKHILEENHEYTLPDNRIIFLPEEWFSKYANLFELGEDNGKTFRLKHPYIGVVESLLLNEKQPELFIQEPLQELPSPPGLKATLRRYQHEGFSWMMHLNRHNLGGCLADDMGLGKTLQTLTLLQHIYGNKQVTADNNQVAIDDKEWADESHHLYAASPQPVDEMGQFLLFDELAEESEPIQHEQESNAPVIVRKPSTLIVVPTSLLHNWRSEAKRFTTLSMAEYHTGSRFRAGHPEQFFNRYRLIFTTYGMMRNNIDTLRQYCFEYIILDESQNIKNSESLTFRSAIQLQSNHRLVLTGTPIENSLKDLWSQLHFLQPDLLEDETTFSKHFITPIRQGSNQMENRLRQLISPFILRRSKGEVAPELPPLTEEIIHCAMTNEQSALYKQEKNSLRNILLQLSGKQEKHQSLTVLNGISRLRQLSCHPSMISSDFTGSSGKLEQIIDTFETLQSEGHKVLIFSSFVKHLELVADAFSQRGWPYALLTGATTNRSEEIARFAESEEIQAFLISLKAGGVGLNLTQADYVFIIDPWWNPAAEAQAIARAHRIGQDKQVIAYRFITLNSIEEKIILLQEGKRKLAETFIEHNDSLPPFTDQEWIGLLE